MSLFHLSSHDADWLFGVSNITIILGTAIVLLGTISAIWSASVRDSYADLRISINEKESANAKLLAAQASERSASLELEATKLRLELEKLLEKQKPRTLSVEDNAKLVDRLKPMSGSPIIITCLIGDTESMQFASQFHNAFLQAGWKVTPVEPKLFTKNIPKGIYICIKNPNALPPESLFIAKVLSELGCHVEINQNLQVPDGGVWLSLCAKP